MEVVFQTVDGQDVPNEELERELEEARRRRQKRAERFGVELREPRPETLPLVRDNENIVKVKRYYNTEQVKRNERAERWGIDVKVVEEKIDDGIDQDRDEMELDIHEMAVMTVGEGNIRDSVLHVHGTDDMSTADVFRYFGSHLPTYLEWIDDTSCNAVFNDHESAKEALYALTEPLVGAQETPFAQYRKGRDWKENHPILMRYAYASDKKEAKKRKRSRYYELYGVPGAEKEPPKAHKRRRMEDKRKVVVAPERRAKLRMDDEAGADITVLIENDIYAQRRRETKDSEEDVDMEANEGAEGDDEVISTKNEDDMLPPAPRKGSVAPPPTPVGPTPPNLFAEGAAPFTPNLTALAIVSEVNMDDLDDEMHDG